MKARWLIGASMTIGLAATVMPACSASTPSPHPTVSAIPIRFGPRFGRDHGPFVTGRSVTLAEAESAFSGHLIRPQTGLASDASIRRVFLERTPHLLRAALDYQSGILVTVELVKGTGNPFEIDPAAQYRSMAVGLPKSQVGTILGVPAWLIPADAQGPAVVDLTMGGERITIYALYAPFDLQTVEGIAQTLR